MDPRLSCRSDTSSRHCASQEQPGVPERSENPNQAVQSTSLSVSKVAQMLQRRASCDQGQHALPWRELNRHPIRSLTPPVEAQMQPQHCPPFLDVLPPQLQTSPPVAAPQPVLAPLAQQLILTHDPPQGSCWLNVRAVAPTPQSISNFSPCVLLPVGNPTEFWCRPYLSPASVLVLPEPPPGCCRCLLRPPVCQSSSSDLASGSAAQQVTQQLRLTESVASSEEEQQKNTPVLCTCTQTPVMDRLQANSTENETPEVSPGSPPPLDEETLAELAFAEYTSIMDSLSLKTEEDVKENEPDEDRETLERENRSIVEYLEELCSDEDFVKEVESTLNPDFFDSLLPADLDTIDILPLSELKEEPLEEIQEERSPKTSRVKAGARSPTLDPSGSQTDSDPNHKAPLSTRNQTGSKADWTTSSPVPPEKTLQGDMFPTAEKPEEASELASNLADKQPAQTSRKLQEGPPPEDPPASEASTTSGVSGSSDDPQAKAAKDPASSLLTVSSQQSTGPEETVPPPPAQIRKPEEQFIPKDINPESFSLEDCAIPVPANSPSESCDGTLSDLVPEKQKAEPPEGLQVPQEAACGGVSSELRPGELAEMESRPETNLSKDIGKQPVIEEEGTTGKTSERKESKADETSVKGTKNTQLTPERDEMIPGDQERRFSGSKGEESPATMTENAVEQLQEMEEKGHERFAGETLKLAVEGGEQCEAKNPNLSAENGAENTLLAKSAHEEKEFGEKKVERKEEVVQVSSFVRRRTRSTTSQEKVQLTPPRGKVERPEMERGEMKSSPKRGLQEEVTDEPQSLPVSSPKKRRSLRVKTDAGSTNCSMKESPEKGPPNVETCEENQNISPALSPSKTVDRQAERGKVGECGEVMGTETWYFYSLRSQNVSKRTVNKKEATHHPSDTEPSPEQTRGITEEAERPDLMLSPMKRHRHGHRASEETETTVNETNPTDSSPKKRGRWRRRVEVNSERGEEKLDDKNEDEAATSGCRKSPSSTGRTIKDKRISNMTGGETFGGKSSAIETRLSRKQANIACTRQTRVSVKLPTKYKSFILYKTNRCKRPLDKKKEEAGKGKTSRGRRN